MNLEKAKQIIQQSDALLITAGAGMGVDSGLPDFRGNEGFWKAYPPIAKLGISFSSMANPKWFDDNPKFAWAFYGHRLNLYRKTIPHKGFYKLLEIGKNKPFGYFVYTSNVDGQFQKAGFDADKIEECHGSIHHLQCTQNCTQNIWSAKDTQVIVDMEKFEAQEPLPTCPNCGAIARPNILMFGDWQWIYERTYQQSIRLEKWIEKIIQNNAKIVIIELGAGKAVPSVRMKSQSIARRKNATLIRINPRDSDIVMYKGVSIALRALEGISKII